MVAFVEKSIRDGALARFSINCWRSHRLRRVVKASLGSEASAMDDGLAELEWRRAMYAESCIPDSTICDGTRFGPDLDSVVVARKKDNEESFMVTDARALYDLSTDAVEPLAYAAGLRLMRRSWHPPLRSRMRQCTGSLVCTCWQTV